MPGTDYCRSRSIDAEPGKAAGWPSATAFLVKQAAQFLKQLGGPMNFIKDDKAALIAL
jgi:hypothetical protein